MSDELMCKDCETCKYFTNRKFTGWGNCSIFGGKEIHEQNVCGFWYPDALKIIQEWKKYHGE